MPGICDNVNRFFKARSLSTSGLTLTWDPELKRTNKRRSASCGPQYCTPSNVNLENTVGVTKVKGGFISCDEFPFAGTEEGGEYFGNVLREPTGARISCVPVWQQQLQGMCNSMLSTLATNVAYADDPNSAADWQSWTADNKGWTTVSASGFGRTTLYPDQIPLAGGIPGNVSYFLDLHPQACPHRKRRCGSRNVDQAFRGDFQLSTLDYSTKLCCCLPSVQYNRSLF